MSVKLAGRLPKDDNENGLNRGEAGFLARPFDQVVVVAYLDTSTVKTDYAKGGKEATVEIAAVEIIDDDEHLAAVRRAFEAAHDLRVNRAPKLPDAEDDDDQDAKAEDWPACESCGHGRDEHSDVGDGCQGTDERGDACECNEYLALCSCGHPWALHDTDTGECWYEFEGAEAEAEGSGTCTCSQFELIQQGIIGEVDPDETESGALTLIQLDVEGAAEVSGYPAEDTEGGEPA